VIPSIARQIARIERGLEPAVVRVGNLEVTRDLLDVRDVVEAYTALLDGARSGSVYNVCRGEGVLLSDVVSAMVQRARVPVRVEIDAARMRPADVPWLVGDPSAIERDLGWRPGLPLERTLDDVLDSWRRAEDGSGGA
jgi:GDP-4-dehydro-6-deoxy-D-mannose reductase